MQLENIGYEELLSVLLDYIRDNYDYELCEDCGDELQYTIDNDKVINISINIERDED